MDFTLDRSSKEIQEKTKAFCLEKLPDQDLKDRDKNEVFSKSAWNLCAAQGFAGLPIPQSFGGGGLSALNTIMALEAFAMHNSDDGLSFSLNAHLLSVVIPLWLYGSEELKKKHLTALASGQKIAAHAMTEQKAGSDVFSMSTMAQADGSTYIINGKKRYITNAPVADMILVYAITDQNKGILGGITPFFMDSKIDGIAVSENLSKMGLRTCTMGHLSFNDVIADEEHMLGGIGGGFMIFQESMNWERIGMSAMMIGATERLFQTVTNHIRDKHAASQQSILHSLALSKARLESIRIMVYKAAWSLDHERQSISAMAASVKLLASELYKQVAMEAVQMMGAAGYLAEAGVERSMRNATAATIYSGTSEIQKNIIAQWLNIK